MEKDELIKFYKKQLEIYYKLIKPEEAQIVLSDNLLSVSDETKR